MYYFRTFLVKLDSILPALLYGIAILIFATSIAVATERRHASAQDICPSPPGGTCPVGTHELCVCVTADGDTSCSTGCMPDIIFTCSDLGLLGTYPDCYPAGFCPTFGQSCTSGANSCGMTSSGTQGSDSACTCSATTPSDSLCPVPPPPSTTCADIGMLGSPYPSGCYAPPPPTTCADVGMLGSPYPSGCYLPPITCADIGMLGSPYPSGCYAPPPPPSGPTILFGSPATIPAGGSATLTWSSSGATSCTGSGFSTGNATSGSKSVSPLSSSSYGLSCTNSVTGLTTNAPPVTITVTGGACTDTGPISLTANKKLVLVGTNVTLTWTGVQVSGNCTLTGPGISQTVTPSSCVISGNVTTPPLSTQSVYTLACPGSQTSKIIINVQGKEQEAGGNHVVSG